MSEPPRAAGHRRWVDGAAAAGLLIVTVVGTLAAATVQQSPRPVDPWAVLLLAAAAAGWWWRLRSPLGGLGIAAAVTAGYVAVGYPFGPVQVVVALAALTLGRRRSGRSTAVGAAVAAGLLAAGLWARQHHVDRDIAVANAAGDAGGLAGSTPPASPQRRPDYRLLSPRHPEQVLGPASSTQTR